MSAPPLAILSLLGVSFQSTPAQSAIQRDPAVARGILNEVLALPVFQEQDWISLLPQWLVPAALLLKLVLDIIWNAMRWPVDRLVDLVTRLVGEVMRGPVVVVLALLVIVGLALLYQRGLRASIVRQAEVRAEDRPLPPTANEALSLAAREANAGHYRVACHFVLLSTLLAIEERGQARFDPSATNREHLALLAGWPRVARALERVVARFDRVWYGQDDVTERDYRDLLALADGVVSAAT